MREVTHCDGPNLQTYSQSLDTTKTINLLRYALEKGSSRGWEQENGYLNLPTKLNNKPGQIQKLKTK
jgi:hypothetical protein